MPRATFQERLSKISVSNDNLTLAIRTYRAIHKHRPRLREMAKKFPLIIEFGDFMIVTEKPDDVDDLEIDLRKKASAVMNRLNHENQILE